MNYIIFDLEFNQMFNSKDKTKNNDNNIPFEIIQIGALKLNSDFKTISTFNTLIKPTIYTTIHPFIEELTNIKTYMLSSCKSFPEVYIDFIDFVGVEEITFVIWGNTDIKELIRNMHFHNINSSSFPKKYIDIQAHAGHYFKMPNSSRVGLKTAIELLNIPITSEFHNAFNDAYYTAEVFKKLYNENIQPKIYTFYTKRKEMPPKKKFDTVALIKQFEKMYDRELSEDEKSIIKLAYIMGKTNQFLI